MPSRPANPEADCTDVAPSAARRYGPHFLAVAWLLLVALAMLGPALLRGPYLGPYQLLTQSGLLHRPGALGPGTGNSDLITEMIPWSTMTWTQVHHGQLPLWNPSSGFGMPLAFNWQSAAFGLPTLVGYLFPLRFAFTISVVVTLVVAGTGTYVFARVLGLGVMASLMAGTFFELSGPFLGWLGYPLGAVLSWMGWLLALGVLIVRGRHRARDITLFAIALAFAVYAGNPESLAVLGFAVGLFFVLVLVVGARRAGGRAMLRPGWSLGIAAIAGLALAAPLALPGYQLASHTVRTSLGGHNSIPLQYLAVILLPNDFRAFANPTLFALAAHVPSTIGFVAVPFALAGVARRWRRPLVLILAVLVIVFVGLVFSGPLESIADHLPFMSKVYWSRALMPMALGLSVLAGVGADSLIRDRDSRRTLLWILAGFVGLGIWLLAAWLTGHSSPNPALAAARDRSFLWPALDVGVGIIVVGALLLTSRAASPDRPVANSDDSPTPGRRPHGISIDQHRRRIGAVATLFVVQTVTLAVVGSSLWQSSSIFLPTNQAVSALRQSVGNHLVGLGPGGCSFGTPVLGLPQETNIAYGIHEVGVYDPIIPQSYYTGWQTATGQPGGIPALASFCPTVTTATIARQFGISYVLTTHGAAGPSGAVFVKTVGRGTAAEDLYKISGVSAATLVAAPLDDLLPPADATGTPVAIAAPNPSTWRMTTSATDPSVLRLRLTNVPGWRATIDGRPLPLKPFSGVLMQARVPAGRHTIVITYWPQTFTLGLVIAVLAALALAVALVISGWQRRRRRTPLQVPV